MKRYFRYRWNETRGDKYNIWGFATFYHEIDENFYAVRQIEIYDGGTALKYDREHFFDEFGILADQSLEEILEDAETVRISQEEFEALWASRRALNE